MAQDLVLDFMSLFAGRGDCYGADHGECIKEHVSDGTWLGHLDGTAPIGIYPTEPLFGDCVRWGCLDIDVPDFQAAENFRLTLEAVGIVGWIELTRSANYHVWVFAQEWVPAATMRRALLVARDAAGLQWVKEVNPKREDSQKIGNYVRCPFPGWLNTPSPDGMSRRQTIINPEWGEHGYMTLKEFVPAALASRTPTAVLERVAKLWTPPKQEAAFLRQDFLTSDLIFLSQQALDRVGTPLIRHIIKEGPINWDKENGRRSGALMRLANQLAKAGATPEETYAVIVVTDATAPWCGKYCVRTDGEQLMAEMVERVFSTVTP